MEKSLELIIKKSDRLLSAKIKRQTLKERFDADITFGYNSGIFKVDQQLITYTNFLLSLDKQHNVILLDINQTPIVIDDLSKFQKDILERYFMALGRYNAGYQDLKNG
jgi:hypothetical protein